MNRSRWLTYSLTLWSLCLLGISGCGTKSATRQALPCREQYESARQKFEKRKYRDAVGEFKLLFFNCPGAPMIDTAQYFLAVSYFNQQDYPTAAGEFRKLLNSFPTSEFADDALFMLGLSDYKQSPKAELDQTYTHQALEHLEDFSEIYPASPLLPEVEKYIRACRDKLAEKAFKNGKTYLRLKYFQAARTYFQEVLEKYPQSKWAAQAQFLIAESYRLANQEGEALAEYQKVVENYADSQFSRKSRRWIEELKGKQPQQN